ncbi:MAG: 50S ribosome-binding GTPase [Candidatus Omnitrophica bacterium]|nr:50S ribosome-binding GTPase [Candidatus Omnitrophota bacterium]MDE2009629.1 50S ribosome-binding GTPase [Candidatus Omnitrophota bacterium]MDE2214443.1 50S ribosome-binding GTPase [Candidatus Omnitrophota bacterium]MDE2231583.1 50S ribosome-binding GTPase [Candidatus Omnitrophota bacterium]
MASQRQQMNVVIVGHVDHGKSTLVGRLLADTGSLPEGKLEAVKAQCKRNAKPFEYAFLLDALKDEQAQGITIDTARSFFKSSKRDYIIIDAPGHIEFLKNMISGAARAEAALLVIDAHEGIKENSKRHGYMMRFLGIKNIAVCVNKMDLVNYDRAVFERIQADYVKFLKEIDLAPQAFIPIAAFCGDNMTGPSSRMPWYQGGSVLDVLDGFQKAAPLDQLPFRMPVQDIYKFTESGDDRRIVAGRVETGSVRTGDEVIFLPSGKKNRIKTVEYFNGPPRSGARAQESIGFTYDTEIYIRPGEVLCRYSQKLPHVSNKFRANVFWMGKQPLIKTKTYKLKIATQQVPVIVADIIHVLNAAELASSHKPHVDRHEVGEIIFETLKPIAFDTVNEIAPTGRFVLVDNYEIAGGGIILAPVFDSDSSLNQHIKKRDYGWERSQITPPLRAQKYGHKSALIIIAGKIDTGNQRIAKAMEEALFNLGKNVYFLGISNRLNLAASDSKDKTLGRYDALVQLGELAHLMTDAGLILITSITDIDQYDLGMLKKLNNPNRTLVIYVGQEERLALENIDLLLPENERSEAAVKKIVDLLVKAVVLDPEYEI